MANFEALVRDPQGLDTWRRDFPHYTSRRLVMKGISGYGGGEAAKTIAGMQSKHGETKWHHGEYGK